MQLNIKYFGLIAAITSCDEESIELKEQTIQELRQILENKYPELKYRDFQIAQNKEIATNDTNLTGEEIALLPPFSGG